MSFYFYIILSLFFCVLYVTSTKTACKAGDPTCNGAARAPYHASLRNARNVHGCSGAIISRSWVITASSCDKFANNVMVGSSARIPPSALVYQVRRFIQRENVSDEGRGIGDVALVLTAMLMRLSDVVAPIAIVRDTPRHDELLNITGWGYTLYPGAYHDYAPQLRAASLRVLPALACRPRADVAHVCALKLGDPGTCLGEPGSPVVWRGQLAALATASAACGGEAEIFASAAFHRTWIQSVIESSTPNHDLETPVDENEQEPGGSPLEARAGPTPRAPQRPDHELPPQPYGNQMRDLLGSRHVSLTAARASTTRRAWVDEEPPPPSPPPHIPQAPLPRRRMPDEVQPPDDLVAMAEPEDESRRYKQSQSEDDSYGEIDDIADAETAAQPLLNLVSSGDDTSDIVTNSYDHQPDVMQDDSKRIVNVYVSGSRVVLSSVPHLYVLVIVSLIFILYTI